MSERDVKCPAETTGVIGGCRFCIYIPGGASDLCVTKANQYDRQRGRGGEAVTPPPKQEVATVKK